MNFGPLAERLRRSTVRVGSGSGTVWGADGLIVTNAHVARGRRAEIELWDGRRFDGEVTARNASRDLAALRVSARDLPAAVPGDSSLLRAGELVLAVGNPLGFIGALSTGVLHGVGPVPGLGRRDWVQAGVRLAPGNSGGPLADAQGRVVGVNAAIAGGLALAVPSNAVEAFLRRGSPPELGVTVRPLGARGMLVLEVTRGSAAEAASIRPGDLLVAAGGAILRDPEDLHDALEASAGLLRLEFRRGDPRRRREVAVRLAAA